MSSPANRALHYDADGHRPTSPLLAVAESAYFPVLTTADIRGAVQGFLGDVSGIQAAIDKRLGGTAPGLGRRASPRPQ
jgi:hypothetical protein